MQRVLDHYTDDFEMTSPYIVSIANDGSGTLKGKEKVGAYWAKALANFPDLRFEIIDVLFSINSITIYYISVSKNRKAAEFFQLNDDGKAYKAIAHYD